MCVCVCRQQQWPGRFGSDGGGGGDDGPDLAHVAQLEVPGRLSESLTVYLSRRDHVSFLVKGVAVPADLRVTSQRLYAYA